MTGEFGALGDVGPVRFQGGVIFLAGYGCGQCGNGFWTEADDKRRLAPGTVHPCPHCGAELRVPDSEAFVPAEHHERRPEP